MTEEQRTAFLAELTELSRRHRIAIGGCGCCGSPSLSELFEKQKSVMSYDGVDGKYAINGLIELEWVKP